MKEYITISSKGITIHTSNIDMIYDSSGGIRAEAKNLAGIEEVKGIAKAWHEVLVSQQAVTNE